MNIGDMTYVHGDERTIDILVVNRIQNVLPVIQVDDEIVPAPSENAGEYTAIELEVVSASKLPHKLVLLIPRGADMNTYLLADAIREE